MYDTVDLWIMGDFWKRMEVKWPPDPHVQGMGKDLHEHFSIRSDPWDFTTRYFIFIRFVKGCYTLERISDSPHYMES